MTPTRFRSSARALVAREFAFFATNNSKCLLWGFLRFCLFFSALHHQSLATSANTIGENPIQNEEKDKPAPPLMIIVLGLPRSGSEALHEFFECNGLVSAHYCCGSDDNTIGETKKKNKKTHFFCGKNVPTCGACVHENMIHARPPFQGCGQQQQQQQVLSPTGAYSVYSQFDVETSDPYAWFLPQHFCLPLLYEAYSDSNSNNNNVVWILNTRQSPTVWADSILHWYSMTQRFFASFGMDYYNPSSDETTAAAAATVLTAPQRDLSALELRQALDRSVVRARNQTAHDWRRHLLEQVYRNHTARVQDFFGKQRHRRRQADDDVLLQVNVDYVAAGTVLAKAFPGFSSDCWKFDPARLDEDWKDVTTLRV